MAKSCMLHARQAACDLDRPASHDMARQRSQNKIINEFIDQVLHPLFVIHECFGVKRATIDTSYHLHLYVFTIKSTYIRLKWDFHIKNVYQIPTL